MIHILLCLLGNYFWRERVELAFGPKNDKPI